MLFLTLGYRFLSRHVGREGAMMEEQKARFLEYKTEWYVYRLLTAPAVSGAGWGLIQHTGPRWLDLLCKLPTPKRFVV